MEEETMKLMRASFATVTLAGVISSQLAFAETPAPPARNPATPSTTPAPAEPAVAKRIETWTEKEWSEAVKEWSKDEAKWASCKEKSEAQKLSGRKSWSFLYTCMTE
ncbi:hypothetical protein [Methylocystis heyeri]|nr:hypothetical protein [Methylocystis heyeri]